MDTADQEPAFPYNLKITYNSNLKTGEISFLVDFISDDAIGVSQHEKDHARFVRKLLEASGILHGSCSVRIRHGTCEEVYVVKKQKTVWEWQKVSSQQTTKIVSLPAAVPRPANSPIIIKNKTS